MQDEAEDLVADGITGDRGANLLDYAGSRPDGGERPWSTIWVVVALQVVKRCARVVSVWSRPVGRQNLPCDLPVSRKAGRE